MRSTQKTKIFRKLKQLCDNIDLFFLSSFPLSILIQHFLWLHLSPFPGISSINRYFFHESYYIQYSRVIYCRKSNFKSELMDFYGKKLKWLTWYTSMVRIKYNWFVETTRRYAFILSILFSRLFSMRFQKSR